MNKQNNKKICSLSNRRKRKDKRNNQTQSEQYPKHDVFGQSYMNKLIEENKYSHKGKSRY